MTDERTGPANQPRDVHPEVVHPSRVVLATVTDAPLDVAAHEAAVATTWAGASVTFAGVVRDHDGGRSVGALFYEAHPDAGRIIGEIAASLAGKFPGTCTAISHRVGPLEIGDVALVAVVASAHRAEAFLACADLVEEVKKSLPVWKRQVFTDGTHEWVGSL